MDLKTLLNDNVSFSRNENVDLNPKVPLHVRSIKWLDVYNFCKCW